MAPVNGAQATSKQEKKTHFPLEVNGELISAARMEITGLPHRNGVQFRISLCYNVAICRLDFTDETHANTERLPEDEIPPMVSGPHFHSWKLNRRFFKGASTAPQLHNAEPYTSKGSFDSNLRWFCWEMNIQQPDGRHVIELPRRTELF
jgi:hypothetical protein